MSNFIKLKTVKNMICNDVSIFLFCSPGDRPSIVFEGSYSDIPVELLNYSVSHIKPRCPEPKDGISEGLYIYLIK